MHSITQLHLVRVQGRAHELGELIRKLEASPDCMRDAVLLVSATATEVQQQQQQQQPLSAPRQPLHRAVDEEDRSK